MMIARAAALGALLLAPTIAIATWVTAADARLEIATAAPTEDLTAVAAAADVGYCSPELKRILRRVLTSCGLMGDGAAGRGCQPVQARNVATMSGPDFNALFLPMRERGGIIQFDRGKAELDSAGLALVDQVFSDQKGASWFFVVARASTDGSAAHNRDLSRQRAEAVMTHLRARFQDPDLDKQVGLLWLGEEFAQLEAEFCDWRRSAAGACTPSEINRSAFVAWIDCQL
jgi:outer membrane protein OmpA-like peptidoglycan-associated protein